jgi:hypothetical protein
MCTLLVVLPDISRVSDIFKFVANAKKRQECLLWLVVIDTAALVHITRKLVTANTYFSSAKQLLVNVNILNFILQKLGNPITNCTEIISVNYPTSVRRKYHRVTVHQPMRSFTTFLRLLTSYTAVHDSHLQPLWIPLNFLTELFKMAVVRMKLISYCGCMFQTWLIEEGASGLT